MNRLCALGTWEMIAIAHSDCISNMDISSLCMGCTTCYAICPNSAISVGIHECVYKPILNSDLCTRCGLCTEICPVLNFGHNMEFSDVQEELRLYEVSSFLVRSSSQSKSSSSGGFVVSLLSYLLEEGYIDGALVVLDDNSGIYRTTMVNNPRMILKSAGSKYAPVDWGNGFREIMNMPGRFAVVGLPCQINAVRRYTELRPALRNKFFPLVSLFCGGGVDDTLLDRISSDLNIHRSEMSGISFREGSWPGATVIKLRNRGERAFDFMKKIGVYINSRLFTPLGCTFCDDYIGRASDFSCGDPWDIADPLQGEGWTLVLAKGNESLRIIDEMHRKGIVTSVSLARETVHNSLMYVKTLEKASRSFLAAKFILPNIRQNNDFPLLNILIGAPPFLAQYVVCRLFLLTKRHRSIVGAIPFTLIAVIEKFFAVSNFLLRSMVK